MAGHSKWHNIQRTKNAADLKRGALFSKISKDIIMAAQLGGSGDPSFNPYLRVAIDKAKASNMPNDKIENAINKGLGKSGSGESMVEKTYEVSGFGGAVFLVDSETDNPNRILTDLKTAVTKEGGRVASEGSFSWQFKEVGKILISEVDAKSQDAIVLDLMSIDGVEDVEYFQEYEEIRIISKKEELRAVADVIREKMPDLKISEISIVKMAKDTIEVSEEEMDRNAKLLDKIKDLNEVTTVWSNLD